jgi:peroxiredoxin
MAITPTTDIPLGFEAPDFTLPDTVSGKQVNLTELQSGKATVVMFICNHCPFVIYVRDELVKMANDYIQKGVAFIAISSNDVSTHPADSPEKMKELAKTMDFPFPYLYDETQEIAKAYDAACTPDFSIFDGAMKCVYRGQLDDARPGNDEPLNGKDIRAALDALLNGLPVTEYQKPSIGCNIKWKAPA